MTTPMPSQGQPAAPENGLGTAALILGILSLFCIPVIGGVLAIVFGKMGMDKADQGLATNRGAAKAGLILGIIGLILAVIGFIIYIVVIAAAVSTGNM